jgi:Predicted membrane protein
MVVVWAARLVIFLLHREFINWPEWHEKVNEVHNRTTSKMKFYVWMTCGAFYSMMTYPCANRMRNAIEQGQDATEWGAVGRTGLCLQTIGLLLESIADSQKGEFKRKTGNRNKWCNVGLWKTFSHPNYLGEAIFWSGVFLGGVGCNETLKDWLISTTGLVFILTVLKGAVESLETKHMKNYSQNPDFIEFKKRRYKV